MSVATSAAFRITVRLPEPLRDGHGDVIVIDTPVATLSDLVTMLEDRVANFATERDELYNFAVNGELVLHGEKAIRLKDGDEIEIVIAFAGG
jgi:molybdopterin converting factor small subunit